ncbi:MAG: DUF5591 domain-containing protein [Euryarchaeota archaeon]|nr:DUF5591 domain-containing protein [Euryarchaeota archaeon]MDE1836725.1 DUF5591 domain-containing protein [Euryarchaeota archaeon]MDE1881754.1 DUF5591 domain-containing protein [Euryarchaeota archaeon]MDE2044709.1 DUF5591 domain-containing protein [Thermoplasmata archaeon]
MRSCSRLDGATLVGEGTVGELQLTLPGVLRSTPRGTAERTLEPGVAVLEEGGSGGPMRRALRWRQGERVLELAVEVAVPEVSGTSGPGQRLAPRVLGVRTPLSVPTSQALREEPWDLVVWMNARATFTDTEGFVKGAIALREAAGPAPMLWAPRVATPGRLSLLFAMGIDLVDTTQGLLAAGAGRELSADAEDLDGADTARARPPLLQRAAAVEQEYLDELARVRRFAGAGRLRELVEARLVPEPCRGELLRYYDTLGAPFQEIHAPVTGAGVRPYTTKEALRRPEVERFRQRFLERYRPPSSKRTLLLVPCSKTKPYASSPTHRRIARSLEGLPPGLGVHWASVTSPLGLVPRELEAVYPARNYDIPVTGAWDEDERRWVRDALQHLLRTGGYRAVVAHLPSEEYAWLKDLLPPEKVAWTVEGSATTSSASLSALSSEMRRLALSRERAAAGGPLARVREELRALAQVQFGPTIADRLFEGEVRLMGRPWFQRLISTDHQDLATWKEETGLWRLTVPGARKIVSAADGYRVEVRGGVELRGDLFAPGVERGDPALRRGDEVLLLRNGEVLGVGEARVPGPWMGRLPRGLVVKVRHRAHGEERTRSTAPPPVPSPPEAPPVG